MKIEVTYKTLDQPLTPQQIETALLVLFNSSYGSITSVNAVRGTLLDDGQPVLIEITNVSLEQNVIAKMTEALTHLLLHIPLTVSATGSERITATSDPEIAMTQVISDQIMRQAEVRANLYDQYDESLSEDYGPEEWRNIRDENGYVIGYHEAK